MFTEQNYAAPYPAEQLGAETLDQLLGKLSLGALFVVSAFLNDSDAGIRFAETRERILMRRDPQRAIEDREMIDRALDMVVGAGG